MVSLPEVIKNTTYINGIHYLSFIRSPKYNINLIVIGEKHESKLNNRGSYSTYIIDYLSNLLKINANFSIFVEQSYDVYVKHITYHLHSRSDQSIIFQDKFRNCLSDTKNLCPYNNITIHPIDIRSLSSIVRKIELLIDYFDISNKEWLLFDDLKLIGDKIKLCIQDIYNDVSYINTEGDLYNADNDLILKAINNIPDKFIDVKRNIIKFHDYYKGMLMSVFPYIHSFKIYYSSIRDMINIDIINNDNNIYTYINPILDTLSTACDMLFNIESTSVDLYTIAMIFSQNPAIINNNNNDIFYGGMVHAEIIQKFLIDNGFTDMFNAKNIESPCLKIDSLNSVIDKYLISNKL